MRNDVSAWGALAPLVLRLALGAILLYHGVVKVLPSNDWGTSWAAKAWQSKGKPPSGVLEKISEVEVTGVSKGQLGSIREQVNKMYNEEAPPLPDPLTFAAAQMAVAWGEVLGGIALLLGALTRIAAVGVLIIQLGAIFTVTYERGFSFASGGGYEYNLALVAICLALVVLGAGPLSFDHWFAQRRKESAVVPGAAPLAGVAS